MTNRKYSLYYLLRAIHQRKQKGLLMFANEKVLNLHFLDYCNFRCTHCFVKREGRSLSFDECKKIVDHPFIKKNFTRINLAGGEPLLSPFLQDLIDYIVNNGYYCSLITNGSLLTVPFIERNKNKLAMIGISVDSLNVETLHFIGRKPLPNLEKICLAIKENNIKLKINICISKLNASEDFTKIIMLTKPDRLKLLQIVSTPHSPSSYDQVISRREFFNICEKLAQFAPICEDNDYMQQAYWIVDSEGCFSKNNLHAKIHTVNLLTSNHIVFDK